MRLFLLSCLTMVAFAANSILNRLALAETQAGPASFAALRITAGALVLGLLLARQHGLQPALKVTPARLAGVAALSVYMLGFSFSYVTLQAGVGALILFGGVQITMFSGAIWAREVISPQRWIGAALSFGGLAYLMWPGSTMSPDPFGSILMAAAALGWGIYSLLGRNAQNPLAETGGNFIWAIPVGLAVFALWPDTMSWRGAGSIGGRGDIRFGLRALVHRLAAACGEHGRNSPVDRANHRNFGRYDVSG